MRRSIFMLESVGHEFKGAACLRSLSALLCIVKSIMKAEEAMKLRSLKSVAVGLGIMLATVVAPVQAQAPKSIAVRAAYIPVVTWLLRGWRRKRAYLPSMASTSP